MWINIQDKQPPLYTQVLQKHANGEISTNYQSKNRPQSPVIAWKYP